MILKLPEKPRLRTYDLDTNDHPEFNGEEIIGEPINIGVRKPKVKHNIYYLKEGYTYLWEENNLTSLDDTYFSIWLIYPKDKRPLEIEIEDYNVDEIIDKVKVENDLKEQRVREALIEREYLLSRKSKSCPKCGFDIKKEYKHAYENNWCPACGKNF